MATWWDRLFRADLLFGWGKAAWALIFGAPTVTAAVSAWLAGLDRQPLSWLFLFGLFGAVGGLLLIGSFHWVYRRFRPLARPGEPRDWSELKETVYKKQYVNEVVEIDRKSFEYCVFRNVRLMYRGTGHVSFLHCKFQGETAFLTDHKSAKAFYALVSRLRASSTIGAWRTGEINQDTGQIDWITPMEVKVAPTGVEAVRAAGRSPTEKKSSGKRRRLPTKPRFT